MNEDRRAKVMAMHAKLAAGEDPSQQTFQSARRVTFRVKYLDRSDASVVTSLQIDDFVFPDEITLYRDEAGRACMEVPTISFRIATYPLYILAPGVESVCLSLADRILPKMRPLGRDRATGVEITASTPPCDRLLEDYDKVRRRVLGKTLSWQATATAD